MLLATVPLSALPASAATPGEALAATGGHGGYSTGSTTYVNALNATDPDVAKVSLAQSAAGVTVDEELVTQDLLQSSILTADAAGKNAYGHGAAANVGLLQAEDAPPQVALSTAEALSPPPSEQATSELLTLPAAPVATAQLLPSTAQARTTSLTSICPDTADGLISEGTAEAANAQLLSPAEGQNVLGVGGTVSSVSQTGLVAPAAGATGSGLSSVTTQSLAPLTLFEGIEGAETTIEVLHQLQLSATAGGTAGSGEVFYGFVDASGERVPDSEPVLLVNGEGLTSEQVLGGDGIQLSLGLADVFIGAPAHGLDDDPTSSPQVAADGTTAAAAADLIRIKVPGTVPTGTTTPVAEDSPLAPVLNPVLTPVVEGLEPVLTGLQQALADAGLDVADVRYGHLEALATVPAGGVVCTATPGAPTDGPFSEARKDVSSQGVAPGATFEYVVRFPNRGDQAVTDVVVTDTFTGGPPPLELVSSDPAATSQDGNVLTYEVGTVEPGEYVDITLVFRVPADAPVGTVYRNDATISGTYRGEQISEDVAVSGPTVIATPTGACDVSRSTKYASNLEVATGQQFAYYVNVSNTGGTPCTGVTVTDELDEGVTFVSCSDDCASSGRTVTWEVGTLAPGASTTLGVVVETVATEGRLPNTAVVDTAEGSTASPSTPGPEVTGTSVPAPGSPAGCPSTGCPGSAVSPVASPGVLPRTGGAPLAALGALLLVGGSLGVRRIVRR